MEQLWMVGAPVTVRQVHESLSSSRELAYTTVMTVLDRLARKGSVVQSRDGRAYRYAPAISRDELTVALMHDALDTVEDSERAAVLVRFVDSVSPDDVAALRAALTEVERGAAGESDGAQ